MTDSTGPMTKAGRRLLGKLNVEPPVGAVLPEDILDIELEARGLEHDRLSRVAWASSRIAFEARFADVVNGLDWEGCGGWGCSDAQADLHSAVLAAIREVTA